MAEHQQGKTMYRYAIVVATSAFVAGTPWLIKKREWCASSVWMLSLVLGWLILITVAKLSGTRLLVDERGRWSLSRLQSIAWMSLLLPTFWTMAMVRLFGGAADPLALDMDQNLWALLGISAVSLVGSPLVLARKQSSSPELLDVPRNLGRSAPGPRDLVRGEDAGNADVLDLSRVQMAFFTAVALCIYFALCWHALSTQHPTALVFPPVSADLVALLGISHATYLANKNIDRPAAARTTLTPKP